jgi:hypothetical protein
MTTARVLRWHETERTPAGAGQVYQEYARIVSDVGPFEVIRVSEFVGISEKRRLLARPIIFIIGS